jgi:DNA-binding transcriptional ArsR family regulator
MTDADFLVVARAAGDPTRLRMLCRLGEGPRSVGQLAASVGVTSSAVTYHLRLMRDAGLVRADRKGRRTVVRRVERRWQTILGALATDE